MKLTQHEILSCTPNSLLCCFIFSIVHHSPYCWWCCYFSLSSFLVIFVWESARAMRTRQQKLCNCCYFHCSRSSSDDHKTMPLYQLDVLKNFSENIFTWAVVFIPYLVIYYYVTSSHTMLCSLFCTAVIQLLTCLPQLLWKCHFMNINIAPSLILREHTFMYIL